MSFPYVAEFECPKGHQFSALVPTKDTKNKARCPHCFEAWVAANVVDAEQVSGAKSVIAEREKVQSV
jgi:hypothetical protein